MAEVHLENSDVVHIVDADERSRRPQIILSVCHISDAKYDDTERLERANVKLCKIAPEAYARLELPAVNIIARDS